ncbi:MAG: hypothetical protein DHS20C15_29400 [Planctomycetota bacterium]|nr:MAG: hypothetical protein DHS20C15_29400 [Planctomycetota bacterium]
MTPSFRELFATREPEGEPEPDPVRNASLLWIAIIAHLVVLFARSRWVEPDPEVFRNSVISTLGVFVLGPAALVALLLGVPSNWNRARMWNGVAVAWLVTAALHGVIVLSALSATVAAD